MRVMVTGATGFVGRHVVAELLHRRHSVIAVARDATVARQMSWADEVEFVSCDLHEQYQTLLRREDIPEVVVHLAWPGLPNYKGFFHISRNLVADIRFLEGLVRRGVKQILVAGTCLEYGMQCGPLEEEQETHPVTCYGLAKDALRKALQRLQEEVPFVLQWMRLFYLYGEGQNQNSLLSQLDRAIDGGQLEFSMSVGDQLRDYLPVQTAARYFALVLESPKCSGVINCCSGKPISVLDLVLQRCEAAGRKDMVLHRGRYSYPEYEPMAFWGSRRKLDTLAVASR